MKVVLLAGPSGSGKSRLARSADALVLRLDDFYLDADTPGLPLTPHGFVDWDDARCWDAGRAVTALSSVLRDRLAEVPVYSIAESRQTGMRVLDAQDCHVLIAEGIFAVEFLPTVREQGLNVEAWYLDRPRALVALLRFRRDVAQHRKPLGVLLRRGYALWRSQPDLKRRAVAAGFTPVTMRRALALLAPDQA